MEKERGRFDWLVLFRLVTFVPIAYIVSDVSADIFVPDSPELVQGVLFCCLFLALKSTERYLLGCGTKRASGRELGAVVATSYLAVSISSIVFLFREFYWGLLTLAILALLGFFFQLPYTSFRLPALRKRVRVAKRRLKELKQKLRCAEHEEETHRLMERPVHYRFSPYTRVPAVERLREDTRHARTELEISRELLAEEEKRVGPKVLVVDESD